MFTPTQVSEMLSIPPSTLRRLASKFSDMLSRQRSRHRRYSESDIALLKRIRDMTSHGMSLDEIRTALTIVSDTPKREEVVSDMLSLMPAVASELDRLDTAYHQVMTELKHLRASHENAKSTIERFEEWLALPWWRRIFSSPPQR
jgi:DNA-binding transcriptional MerR regulator